jgi:hypothetical protein
MTRWAVELVGRELDLGDWKQSLLPPFEPYVEVVDLKIRKGYLLNSTKFLPCREAREVRECAIPIIRILDGLMQAYKNTGKVTSGAIVEATADGSYRRHVFAEANITEDDDRVSATGVLLGSVPQPAKPSVAQPSFAQTGLALARKDLKAALEHYSRADNWYDLYKSFEAVRKKGDSTLEKLGVGQSELSNFRGTANKFRHHRGKSPPKRELSLREGRTLVATLLKGKMEALGFQPSSCIYPKHSDKL